MRTLTYRPIPYTFHVLPRCLVLFYGRLVKTPQLPTPPHLVTLQNEKIHDLECVEIRERRAHSDQFRYCGVCTPERAGHGFKRRGPGLERGRADDG